MTKTLRLINFGGNQDLEVALLPACQRAGYLRYFLQDTPAIEFEYSGPPLLERHCCGARCHSTSAGSIRSKPYGDPAHGFIRVGAGFAWLQDLLDRCMQCRPNFADTRR